MENKITVKESIQEKFNKRRSLIMKDELTPEEENQLQDLENEIDEIPVTETKEYIKAMKIIQKAAQR